MVMTSQAHVSIHGCLSDTPVVGQSERHFPFSPGGTAPRR